MDVVGRVRGRIDEQPPWFARPTADEVLPENNPDTLTGLVRSVIQRVDQFRLRASPPAQRQ
jgi:hypothetical protein